MNGYKNFIIADFGTLIFILAILIYRNIMIPAITMRYQTKGTALIETNSPSMAVNPAMKTKKCKWRLFFILLLGIKIEINC